MGTGEVDVEAAAAELYALPPEQFVARRNELAAGARAAGDSAARDAIATLRRPSIAAWAVNLLTHQHHDELDALMRLAVRMRTAQRELAAEQLRTLTAKRRSAVAALVKAARVDGEDAGRRLSDAVLLEVQATLDAAVADEQAELAVRSGRLTTSLSYNGFGAVDVTDVVALPPAARPKLSVVRDDDRATRARAEREREFAQAQARLAEAADRREQLSARVEALRTQLREAEQELRAAETAERKAQRHHDAACRAVTAGRSSGGPVT